MERLNKLILTIGFILITISTSLLAGGPWPQPKSKGYFKLSEWWVVFDEHYTDTGLRDPNTTNGVFNTLLYAEYGLSNRLTGIFNGAIFSRNYMNNVRSLTTGEIVVPGESLNGIGDINIGLKYGLNPSSSVPISVSLILGLPTGKSSGGSLGALQNGDGEFNQMIQIDVGKGFQIGNSNGYFSIYSGINNRTNEFSEEFHFGGEVGLSFFSSRLWLAGKINVVESFKNGSTAASTTATSIFANNAEFTSITAEANYYLSEKFGLSLSVSTATRGEIIAAAPSYSFGVFADLSK